MKTEPDIDEEDEGIVAWLNIGDDPTLHPGIAIDVCTFLGTLQAGVTFSPARARRLAEELLTLADHIEPAGKTA